MSASGPSLKSRGLWAKREKKCLRILCRALLSLREEADLPEAEVDLNRRLYFCLLSASRELDPNEVVAPSQECNNQPDPNDEARAMREQKRPDFQWIYLDRYESDTDRSSKQFVVECKRLGESSRADWVLNSNYVEHGISRFRDPEWGYGKRFPRGAMIGYWQSMDANQILQDVNGEARKRSFPELILVGNWKSKEVNHLKQTFERSFEVSPFELRHLWIDIRHQARSQFGPSSP
jgi:hypothetical protein